VIPTARRGYIFRGIVKGTNASKYWETMDNVTLIRIVAGVLAVFVFVVLLFRMKKKAPL